MNAASLSIVPRARGHGVVRWTITGNDSSRPGGVAVPSRQSGDRVEITFLAGDDPFIVFPATVVEDTGERIAHYLAAGTGYLRRELLDGSSVPRVVPLDELARMGSRLSAATWHAHHLVVTNPQSAHGIRHKWNPESWEFEGWYVNLQQPLTRTKVGFTTVDQFLDILVQPDLSWEWKDEDELELAVDRGRITLDEAATVRAEGERVVADIEARRFPFDGALIDWRPDPAWPIPDAPVSVTGESE